MFENIGCMQVGFYLLVTYIGTQVLKWIVNYVQRILIINKIPGPFMIPFIGNVLTLIKNEDVLIGLESIVEPFRKDRSFCRFWLGTDASILFFKADWLHILLDSSKHIKKSKAYDGLKAWVGDSLGLTDGEKWVKRRKMLTPAFHFDVLKRYYVVMNEKCDCLAKRLEQVATTDSSFDLLNYLKMFTLDVISETAMGVNLNTQKGESQEYAESVERITSIIIQRAFQPWLKRDFVFYRTKIGKEFLDHKKIIQEFTDKVIQERLKDFNEITMYNEDHRFAFLDLLLKNHKENPTELPLDSIRNEVDTFMFAGHDTSASAALWLLFVISQYPECQKKIHEEIDSVIIDSDAHVNYDFLSKLKYLECVTKESERLYPTVALFARELTEDIVIENYRIPKGTTAQVFTQAIHRDERYFPEPEKFIPERFLPENSVDRHPYTFIPFSAGKRNCIGQRFAQIELKLLITRILRNYEIFCDTSRDQIKFAPSIVTRSAEPILFKLKKRF